MLLEVAAPVRASLVMLLDDVELVSLGAQMEAEDFADLVQDLPPERASAVLAQLNTTARAEVQSVMSFPDDSVGALMSLEVVSVRGEHVAGGGDRIPAAATAGRNRSRR